MAVAHSNLTTTELHEPKGADAATSGDVYLADGVGSGSWTSLAAQITGAAVPVGTIVDYAGTSAPSGWLFIFGQDVSRATYSDLFTALSTTYGVGDGSTTFGLPDCRGRVIAGRDDMGTVSANRLTDPAHGFGLNGDTIGDAGGQEDHTPILAEVFAHTHSTTLKIRTQASGGGSASNSVYAPDASTLGSDGGTEAKASDSKGSSTAFNVVQPTIILNKIIFTNV